MSTARLQRSAVLAFFYFGAVLIGLYAVVAALTAAFLEDRVLVRRLEIEVEEYLARLEGLPPGQPLPPPSTRFMRGYIGIENVPTELRPWVRDPPDGFHEVGDDAPNRSRPFIVAIRQLPDDRGRLFLFYEVSRLGVRGEWIGSISVVLASGALIVSLLGVWWGRRLAARLVAPVVQLAETVENSPPSALVDRIRAGDYPMEVAQLADALGDALERIEAFIQRERSFTHHASHELRTPVTAARGAAELLAARLPKEDERAQAQWDRLSRSIHRMEDTIEAFLCLAREDGSVSTERCRPAELLPEIVARHRHLLKDRPVEVLLDLDDRIQIPAPRAVFIILVGKLVAHAFYRSRDGSVRIRMQGETLGIADTGEERLDGAVDLRPGLDADGHSGANRGFGLAIVMELCERFGWSVRRTPTPSGMEVEVTFSGADDAVDVRAAKDQEE